jgi:hypothetical protein
MGWRLAGAGRLRGGPARTERATWSPAASGRARLVRGGAGRRIVEFLKKVKTKVLLLK